MTCDLLPYLDFILYQLHCIFGLYDHFLHSILLSRLISHLVHEAVSTLRQLFLHKHSSPIYLQILRSSRRLSLLQVIGKGIAVLVYETTTFLKIHFIF